MDLLDLGGYDLGDTSPSFDTPALDVPDLQLTSGLDQNSLASNSDLYDLGNQQLDFPNDLSLQPGDLTLGDTGLQLSEQQIEDAVAGWQYDLDNPTMPILDDQGNRYSVEDLNQQATRLSGAVQQHKDNPSDAGILQTINDILKSPLGKLAASMLLGLTGVAVGQLVAGDPGALEIPDPTPPPAAVQAARTALNQAVTAPAAPGAPQSFSLGLNPAAQPLMAAPVAPGSPTPYSGGPSIAANYGASSPASIAPPGSPQPQSTADLIQRYMSGKK